MSSYPATAERVEALSAHHAGGIPSRQAEVLLLHAFGMSDIEAAHALLVSPGTVRSAAREARARVVPPELHPARANASAWTHLHFNILHRDPARRSRFDEIWQKRLVR